MYDKASLGTANNALQGSAMRVDCASNPAKVPTVTETLIGDLQFALERAKIIESRLYSLNDRIFGSVPETASGTGALKGNGHSGLLGEVGHRTSALLSVLDNITHITSQLERLG